jgi:hypothetical protein
MSRRILLIVLLTAMLLLAVSPAAAVTSGEPDPVSRMAIGTRMSD